VRSSGTTPVTIRVSGPAARAVFAPTAGSVTRRSRRRDSIRASPRKERTVPAARSAARRLPLACLAALAIGAAPGPAAAADLAERARTLVGAGQGVHVETEDGKVLVSQAADRAVHPASVSKVPTTLALLEKLGSRHRFETRVLAAGGLEGGVLAGDLVVEATGDPFFVDENALVAALRLRELGLRRVTGGLVVRGPLLFNWSDAGVADRLRRALAGQVAPGAWQAVRGATRSSAQAPPRLEFGGGARSAGAAERLLLTHRSEPLIPLLKALNGYSNNVFAWLASAAGGTAAVAALARARVPAPMRGEIVLGDGAGAHPRNRISPRAAVALLRALQDELEESGGSLADVLPVAGVDPGTLLHRLAAPGERGRVVAKTGTYGDYGACALAGALRGPDGRLVYFAILNHGVPIDTARRRQDAFVRELLAAREGAPWPYARDEAPSFARAQLTSAPAAAERPPARSTPR
jgi:D-alanyl-D-alanine carboxypeptidase/D-alanyl-D-alanine-endopeptidase (penicillin-binding protein 4)